MRRPHIAITCYNPAGPPNHLELYAEAVASAGGIPRLISDDRECVTGFCDGLVVPGGRDLPPSMYNEEDTFPSSVENKDRIDFDIRVLSDFLRRRRPVLGICYGMQLINVFFGGTLFQDIASQAPASLDHSSGAHQVVIAPNGFIPEGNYQVPSSHHQGIKEPGSGLRPFVFSPDGIIEGVYSSDYDNLIGVQWHPERSKDTLSRALFASYVRSCRIIVR
ncbi:MAG: gamma-glutamyl-gamma-aminobutyrate hydrolase family protein [Nitrospirae bacterium]|nr:gamma-glutamyl-gamma-aminobutyrate hydrolase family protein [Nitrospirota bacterium]